MLDGLYQMDLRGKEERRKAYEENLKNGNNGNGLAVVTTNTGTERFNRLDSDFWTEVPNTTPFTHWSPHQVLMATHQCDTLKFQRFGVGIYQNDDGSLFIYGNAAVPGRNHPDGPKWLCPELFEEKALAGTCVVFSVGSFGDFKFESSIRGFVGEQG
ncbi:hypothetical protein HDU76_007712, partial [Blyttiomyces sp. JEL0837]